VQRRLCEPRPGWQETIEAQGLLYWKTDLPDGTVMPYWTDGAYYAFTSAQIDALESATEELVEMCVAAGDHIIEHDLFARMGIPEWAEERIVETWSSEPPMLYGRFDLAYDGTQIKLLEFNADTPTGLVESAVIQWFWIKDRFPGLDQFNRLHDALVSRWSEMGEAGRLPGGAAHFAWSSQETSGEDAMTAAYLAQTAQEAGLRTVLLPVEELGWNDAVGFLDPSGTQIKTIFKLYPWEWMVRETYGQRCLHRMGAGPGQTQWIEPVWKMLWSNKGLLPVLWELFPGHELLLPAWFADDAPDDGLPHVRKPLLAREGANVTIVGVDEPGVVAELGPDQGYGEEGYVVQRYVELPAFPHDGPGMGTSARPVIGSWLVDMAAAGIGVREADGLITNNLSRFLPHVIDG